MVTIEQIAKTAKVSRYTASKVLNGNTTVRAATRKKILAICKELGYIPNLNAVNLVRRKSSLIGLVVPYITDGFYASLIEKLEQLIQEKAYMLIYKSSYNDAAAEREAVRQFLSLNICALLIVPVVVKPDRETHDLAAKNIPVIYLDRPYSEKTCCVLNDNFKSAETMTSHLLKRTRELAFLDSFYGISNPTAMDRRKGYESVMKKHHLKPQIISDPEFPGRQDNEEYAYAVMKKFFQSGKSCDGLFCVTDAAAFGAAQAVREIGRIPGKDFFIGGHDNLRFSLYANPPITTMEQPLDAICQTAIELLFLCLEGKNPRKLRYAHPSSLIVRKSG
ncbi:MAG: LacI family DNA-binding transcriptional regulator [Lentisphaeria bacterium]|nr:LacI family DNA-binding transcriptional regulator [Lentisphaeria bacterium]